jgi:hypothetical protein
MAHREMQPSGFRLIALLTIIAAAAIYVRASTPLPSPPSEGEQIGKILSVRKVLENRRGNREERFQPQPASVHC